MRYFFLLLFGCLFCTSLMAQEGLKLGVYVTPGLALPGNAEDAQQGTLLQNRAAFSYNSGLLFGYGLTDLFSIQTGVGFHQFTAAYEHRRQQLPDGHPDPNLGAMAVKRSQYLRVPLLFEVSTDPNRRWGVIGRVGFNFDFLLNAVYYDQRLIGYSNYLHAQGIDLTRPVTLYQANPDGTGLMLRGGKAAVYRDFITGFTAQVGLQFRLSDALKITAMVYVETASNPEDEGAASLGHNLNRGDYLVTADPLLNRTMAQQDASKQRTEGTPFEAIFPNYTDPDQPYATSRSATWNTLIGLQIGMVYTIKN